MVLFSKIIGLSLEKFPFATTLFFLGLIMGGLPLIVKKLEKSNNEKSNIFTSNQLAEEEMEHRLGVRLASRIWNTSQIIIFNGKDRRKA